MNLGELKRLALFQTNNDEEELEELGPYLTEYLNEGYRRLWQAFGRGGGFEPLRHDRSRPEVPELYRKSKAEGLTEAEKKEAEASPGEGRRFRHIPG